MADFNTTWGRQACAYATSISTGTVKAGQGVLRAVWCTTAGSFAFKDGTAEVGKVTLAANEIRRMPGQGVFFGTAISVSASAGVATILYA